MSKHRDVSLLAVANYLLHDAGLSLGKGDVASALVLDVLNLDLAATGALSTLGCILVIIIIVIIVTVAVAVNLLELFVEVLIASVRVALSVSCAGGGATDGLGLTPLCAHGANERVEKLSKEKGWCRGSVAPFVCSFLLACYGIV